MLLTAIVLPVTMVFTKSSESLSLLPISILASNISFIIGESNENVTEDADESLENSNVKEHLMSFIEINFCRIGLFLIEIWTTAKPPEVVSTFPWTRIMIKSEHLTSAWRLEVAKEKRLKNILKTLDYNSWKTLDS